MNKINIVYVGDKLQKKDTITGSRLVFPRDVPVAVDSDIAYQLLDYPTVFVKAEEADAFKSKVEEETAARIQAEKEAKEEAERLAKLSSLEITLNGQVIDLGKYNKTQLKTLVEAEDLPVEHDAQEKVEALRKRVFNALTAKYQPGE